MTKQAHITESSKIEAEITEAKARLEQAESDESTAKASMNSLLARMTEGDTSISAGEITAARPAAEAAAVIVTAHKNKVAVLEQSLRVARGHELEEQVRTSKKLMQYSDVLLEAEKIAEVTHGLLRELASRIEESNAEFDRIRLSAEQSDLFEAEMVIEHDRTHGDTIYSDGKEFPRLSPTGWDFDVNSRLSLLQAIEASSHHVPVEVFVEPPAFMRAPSGLTAGQAIQGRR
ncbi:hypothetical protein GCM10027403_14510 [Arthrobacter tecti]